MLFSTKTCGALLLTSLSLVSQAHVVANFRYNDGEHGGLSARHLPERDVYLPALHERELYERNAYAENVYRRGFDGVILAERDVYDAGLIERDVRDTYSLEGNLYKRGIQQLVDEDLRARGLAPPKVPPKSPSKNPSADPSKRRLCSSKSKRSSPGRRSPEIHQVDMSNIEYLSAPQPIGTDGLCGCTAIIIASATGTLVGHLDEMTYNEGFKRHWKAELQSKITENKVALAHGKAYVMYPTLSTSAAIYPRQLEMLEAAISESLPGVNVKSVGYHALDQTNKDWKPPRGSVEVTYVSSQPVVSIEGVVK